MKILVFEAQKKAQALPRQLKGRLATHALIIEPDLAFAAQIGEELVDLGFGSFDHAWTEKEAVVSALTRCPDLIVGDHLLHEGSDVAAIREICR